MSASDVRVCRSALGLPVVSIVLRDPERGRQPPLAGEPWLACCGIVPGYAASATTRLPSSARSRRIRSAIGGWVVNRVASPLRGSGLIA